MSKQSQSTCTLSAKELQYPVESLKDPKTETFSETLRDYINRYLPRHRFPSWPTPSQMLYMKLAYFLLFECQCHLYNLILSKYTYTSNLCEKDLVFSEVQFKHFPSESGHFLASS